MQSTGQPLVHIRKQSSKKAQLNFNWIFNFTLCVSFNFLFFVPRELYIYIYIKPKLRKNQIRFYN